MTFLRATVASLAVSGAMLLAACGETATPSDSTASAPVATPADALDAPVAKLDEASVRAFMSKFDAATEARDHAAIDALIAPDFATSTTAPDGTRTQDRAQYLAVAGTPGPANATRHTTFVINDVTIDATGARATVAANADTEYTAATGAYQGKRIHEVVDYVYTIELRDGVPMVVFTEATFVSASVDGERVI